MLWLCKSIECKRQRRTWNNCNQHPDIVIPLAAIKQELYSQVHLFHKADILTTFQGSKLSPTIINLYRNLFTRVTHLQKFIVKPEAHVIWMNLNSQNNGAGTLLNYYIPSFYLNHINHYNFAELLSFYILFGSEPLW